MVGQVLVEGVAEIPAVGQVEAGRLDQLALGADALEEHDELQLEEDRPGRCWAGPARRRAPAPSRGRSPGRAWPPGGGRSCPGNEVLQRDGDRLVEAAGLGGAEHRRPPGRQAGRRRRESTDPRAQLPVRLGVSTYDRRRDRGAYTKSPSARRAGLSSRMKGGRERAARGAVFAIDGRSEPSSLTSPRGDQAMDFVLNFVGVAVADFARSFRFYTEVLGVQAGAPRRTGRSWRRRG